VTSRSLALSCAHNHTQARSLFSPLTANPAGKQFLMHDTRTHTHTHTHTHTYTHTHILAWLLAAEQCGRVFLVSPCSALIKMSECSSCQDPIPEDTDYCKCSVCNSKLHFSCADVTEANWNRYGDKRRRDWKCRECIAACKLNKKDLYKNELSHDFLEKLQNDLIAKFDETIKKQFDQYKGHFDNQMKDLKTSVQFVSDQMDDFKLSLEAAMDKIKSMEHDQEQLRSENTSLKAQLNDCLGKLENLEQYGRNRNLQIDGIPEVAGEKMSDIVKVMSDVIEEPIDFEVDIQAIHRIPTKRNKGPKPIIAQFSNRQKRDLVLKKCKSAVLRATQFQGGAPNTVVYVNEHLTAFNKNLLFNAKKLKLIGYKYVWPAEGKIYVRKSDGAPRVHVTSLDQLSRLAGRDITTVTSE